MRELIWLATPATLLVTEDEIEVARDKNEETFAAGGGGGGGCVCLVGEVGAEMVFFFEPKVSVRGGSASRAAAAASRAAAARRLGAEPGVAEVGLPGTAPPSSSCRSESSFSPARSPCEKRLFRNEVVEVNLWPKFAKDEMLAAGVYFPSSTTRIARLRSPAVAPIRKSGHRRTCEF